MDLASWLQSLGLGQYSRAFSENDIDTKILAELTDADLRELGVTSLGHRKRLLSAIETLRTGSPAPPPAASPPAGERRLVTILFADLSGFTALSQTLDPEELHALVVTYTKLVDGIIGSFDGTVDKHIGDAVMALFGAPIAHDDDPLRASRAALEIHEALARMSESEGRHLQAHVGIATGEVLAGALGRGDAQDYTVLGDSVNLSARLVAMAAPGQTLISNAVHRALSGRAVCEPAGEMQFKGISGPIRVWRLLGVSSEPAPGRSAFVGREAELGQFREILSAALARQSGQVVYVRGEAGIGKTRLVEEMSKHAAAQGVVVHRTLVLDFGVERGQHPVRRLVRSLLGLPDGASETQRLDAAHAAIGSGTVSPGHAHFLHDLLDLPQLDEWRAVYQAMDNATRNRGKCAVMVALVTSACRHAPAFIIVEDLHWADPQVLDHLAAIASSVAGVPGLLAMTSRVEGDRVTAAWRSSCRGTPFVTIDLGPLRTEEAMRLAGGFVDAVQHLAQACIDRAGGNPLFLEQLLRNAEEGTGDAIPASVQSLVLARMDRLKPLDRQAFQAASIAGQRFDLKFVRRLLNEPDYICDNLLEHALVVPDGDGFLFTHALIQEGAYSSLLRARRRELHRAAAEWFGTDDPVLRAQHLDRAEDERAPAAYLEAAAAQRAAYHTEVALRLVERGLEIVGDDNERHALICLRGELQRDLGDVEGSIATYREAIATAPNEIGLCEARLGLAEGLRVTEGLAEALALLDAAQKQAEAHALVADLARLHHLRANILFPRGDIEGCREEHGLGLKYARQSGSPEAEARALGGLGDAFYAQGRMETAFRHFSRCVEISREHGFGRIEVANRPMVGFSRIYLNEPRAAREDADAARRTASLVGQPRAMMLAETSGVFANYELGDYAAMTGCMERELPIIQQLGARRFEAQNLEMHGRLLLDAGKNAEAAARMHEALAICRDVGTQFSGPKLFSALSRTEADPGERRRLLDEGEDLLRRGAVSHNHLWFYRDAIEAMLEAGDSTAASRYADQLQLYTQSEPLPWSDLFVARARALVRVHERFADDATRAELTRVRDALLRAELRAFLAPVDAALATISDADESGSF